MRKQHAIILVLTAIVLSLYTNCSGDYGQLSSATHSSVPTNIQKGPSQGSTSENSGGIGNNGGGYSGKVTMDFFEERIICSSGSNWAQQLDIDFEQQSAYLQEQKCDQNSEGTVLFNDIFFTSYNPWFAWYDNKVFANRDLHTDLNGRIKYILFCFNTTEQVDFSVQYYRPNPINGVRQSVQIHGYLFRSEGETPLRTQGHIGDASGGSRTFRAFDSSYSVDVIYPAESPAYGSGTLRVPGEEDIPMECRFYVPETSDNP